MSKNQRKLIFLCRGCRNASTDHSPIVAGVAGVLSADLEVQMPKTMYDVTHENIHTSLLK